MTLLQQTPNIQFEEETPEGPSPVQMDLVPLAELALDDAGNRRGVWVRICLQTDPILLSHGINVS